MPLKHIETQADYQEYQKQVASFLADNRVQVGCHGPYDSRSEPFFSWSPCECCQRNLGGNRETYSFSTLEQETFNAAICTDCVYYLAYGQLDDLTMLELKP